MIDFSDLKDAARPLRFFDEFSRIPHGSGNTALIADYLVDFAKERGLEYMRDAYDNVVIRKPATRGMESRDAVIIQGHLDMVCQKTENCSIDFSKDSLEIFIDGEDIILKKYSMMKKINDLAQELTDAIYTFTRHNVFITDTNIIIAGSGNLKKTYIKQPISNFIEKSILPFLIAFPVTKGIPSST